MNIILKELVDRICIVYINDILIFLDIEEQHKKDVFIVLEQL